MTLDGRGLRVAIIGGGFMGRVHAQAVRAAGAELTAVAATTLERSVTAADALGAARGGLVDDLLTDAEIDVVHICTPNETHAELSLAALAAGKHVICEKPIATSSQSAAAIAAAAIEGRRLVTVPFVYRFHPLVREIRARLANETVRTFHGQYLQDWLLGAGEWNWRVDSSAGGPSRAFADIGSHLVDILEFVTGTRLSTLSATTSTVHPERDGRVVETEDAVAAVATLEGGAIGTLLVSQVAPGNKNGLVVEISTDEATYRFRQEQPEEIWIGRRDGSVSLPRDPDQLSEDAARLSILPGGHPQGYQDAFNAFVADSYAAFRGDVRPGLPTAADGARAARLTEAVMRSADAMQFVDTRADLVG